MVRAAASPIRAKHSADERGRETAAAEAGSHTTGAGGQFVVGGDPQGFTVPGDLIDNRT